MIFYSLDCSQVYRKTFLSILTNKLPSWHTQNHSSLRFSCQYQQKDEGKELGHELKRESMYHDLPISNKKTTILPMQEHKLSQGYQVTKVVPINGFIFLPIMCKRVGYHYIKKNKKRTRITLDPPTPVTPYILTSTLECSLEICTKFSFRNCRPDCTNN